MPGCGSRPRLRGASRVRRARSARGGGCGAVDRRPHPAAAAALGAAERSVRNPTPFPGVGVAVLCRCAGRTGCPAGTAGRPPGMDPATSPDRAAAAARSMPRGRRPRSTAGCSHHPKRRNRHIGHAGPGRFDKFELRVRGVGALPSQSRTRTLAGLALPATPYVRLAAQGAAAGAPSPPAVKLP